MEKKLTDLDAINRIGSAKIGDHFAISRQAVYYWRSAGIPKQYRKPMILLAQSLGVDFTGFRAE